MWMLENVSSPLGPLSTHDVTPLSYSYLYYVYYLHNCMSFIRTAYYFLKYSVLVLFQGHTAVLVGIKADIGKPRPAVPNEGYLEFFVDW